jgi:trans-aconitate methyltransferase
MTINLFSNSASFNKAASSYSAYNKVQAYVFDQLCKVVKKNRVTNCVDIGCASGENTYKLFKLFNNAHITGIDSSVNMIAKAKEQFSLPNLEFQLASYDYIANLNKVDCIISNVSMQWFENLDNFFERLSLVSSNKPQIVLSAFLPGTYQELAEAIRACVNPDFYIPAESFYSETYYSNLVQEYFPDLTVNLNSVSTTFKSVKELLKTIQLTGVNSPDHRLSLTKSSIKNLENYLLQRHGCIRMTFRYVLIY